MSYLLSDFRIECRNILSVVSVLQSVLMVSAVAAMWPMEGQWRSLLTAAVIIQWMQLPEQLQNVHVTLSAYPHANITILFDVAAFLIVFTVILASFTQLLFILAWDLEMALHGGESQFSSMEMSFPSISFVEGLHRIHGNCF